MKNDWELLQDAFEGARDLPASERSAFLARQLGNDREAIERVESMLRADAIESLPIDRRMQTLADELLDDAPPVPERIGPYRIVGTLGRGGMGVVYRGLRPDLDRTDAIKVLYGTSLSPLRRELFDRERRMLASLKHPSIAQIYDSGSLEDGTPYFVMEEVTGLPLDEAVESRSLSAHERLGLLLNICDAVQYAHARGVIHRDLKSSNLLVPDGEGPTSVKLLDFGIARRPDDDTAEPDDVELVGTKHVAAFTPAYAAPEQISGDAETVLTDVYALGVLLHELLARRRPRPAAERSGDPTDASPVPSRSPRRIELQSLGRWRELDAICAKALQLAPEDRYATVDALADDLRRFLEHLPVRALPASFSYAVRKLARRHRLRVAAGLAVALLLLGATLLVFLQANRIANERDRAERERANAEQLSGFLLELFQASDPAQSRGKDLLARDLLDSAAASLLRPSESQPADRVRFLYAIARAYDHLGLYAEQADMLRSALGAHGLDARVDPPSATLLRAELAGALLQLGQLDEAETLLAERLEHANNSPPVLEWDRLALDSKTAHLRYLQGRLEEAEAIFLEVIPALETAESADLPQRYHESVANLAAVYSHQGRFDDAGTLYDRAIDAMTRMVGSDHPRTLMQRGNLAALEIRRKRFDEARALLVPLLDDKRRVLGDRHADTLRSINALAVSEHYLGNLPEAEALFREALTRSEETLPEGHRETLALIGNLAAVLVDSGKVEDGRALHQQVYDGFRSDLGERHRYTALGLHNLAGANTLLGKHALANRQYREVQEIWEETLPPAHPYLPMNLDAWAELQRRLGDGPRAEELTALAEELRASTP